LVRVCADSKQVSKQQASKRLADSEMRFSKCLCETGDQFEDQVQSVRESVSRQQGEVRYCHTGCLMGVHVCTAHGGP